MSFKSDPAFTYQNSFQNTIFSNQESANMSAPNAEDPVYQRFTATGRPITSSQLSKQTALSGGGASFDSLGSSAPNLLPVRFTDNSIISVPVLPHSEPSVSKTTDSDSDNELIKESKSKSRLSFSAFRRKSSAGNTKKGKQDFVIKQMTRANYLLHYAKDDNGKYIGTEEPALDCILGNEEDRVKWRRA